MFIYLSILLQLTTAIVHETNFEQIFQTGSASLRSANSTSTSTNATVTLAAAFIQGSYDVALSLQKLQMQKSGMGHFSLQIQAIPGTSSLVIAYTSPSQAQLPQLQIRFLAVVSSFPYLTLATYTSPSSFLSDPYLLDNTQSLTQSLQISQTTPTSTYFTSLVSFSVNTNTEDIFQLMTMASFQNSTSIIKIYNMKVQYVDVFRVKVDVVAYDAEGMEEEYGYQFNNGHSDKQIPNSGNNVTFCQNGFSFKHEALFFGINDLYHQTQTNTTLNFSITPTSNYQQLKFRKQNNLTAQTFFLILSQQLTCDTDQGWNSTSNRCQLCVQKLFIDSQEQCQHCSENCKKCLNQTQCTQCLDAYYLNDSSGIGQMCQKCQPGCKKCDNEFTCQNCANNFFKNSFQICQKCGDYIPNCWMCLNSERCTRCYDPYIKSSNGTRCLANCGDGVATPEQQCDDGPTASGDGCSQLCQIQPYHSCQTNPHNKTSQCFLTTLDLTLQCIVKDPYSNMFTVLLSIFPKGLKAYQTAPWLSSIQFTSTALEPHSFSFDPQTDQLKLTYTYSSSPDMKNTFLSLNLTKMPKKFWKIALMALQLEKDTQNNLSVMYYEEQTYFTAQIVEYIAYVLVSLALLLFLLGNLGAKLIALECIAIFQLIALLQFTLHRMTPIFAALHPLNLSLGFTYFLTPQNIFSTSSGFPSHISAQINDRNPIMSINIALVAIVGPILIGIILKIISVTAYQDNQRFDKTWRHALGTYTFYGIVFLAYGELIIFMVNLRYLEISQESGIGLIVGSVFCILTVLYLIALNKHGKWFGSFKSKFERYTFGSYYYTLSILQRFITCTFIACMSPLNFTPAAVGIILMFELIFIYVKRPYVLQQWKRPCFCKVVAIILCLLYLAVNLTEQGSTIALYCPFAILLLLTVVLVVSIYSAIISIKTNLSQIEIRGVLPMTTKECNDRFEKQFSKQMQLLQKNQFISVVPDLCAVNLIRQKWNWECYPKLYSIDIHDTIKQPLKKVQQEQQNSQYREALQQKKQSVYQQIYDAL